MPNRLSFLERSNFGEHYSVGYEEILAGKGAFIGRVMLDNMEEATLNNWPVYYKIQSNMLKYVIGEASLEESFQNCMKELNEYVNTFTFEGQLQDGINFDY